MREVSARKWRAMHFEKRKSHLMRGAPELLSLSLSFLLILYSLFDKSFSEGNYPDFILSFSLFFNLAKVLLFSSLLSFGNITFSLFLVTKDIFCCKKSVWQSFAFVSNYFTSFPLSWPYTAVTITIKLIPCHRAIHTAKKCIVVIQDWKDWIDNEIIGDITLRHFNCSLPPFSTLSLFSL